MSGDIPDDLRYTVDHAWLRLDERSGEATIGITYFAQEQLGDVVYLELPDAGTAIRADQPYGEIESAKTVTELIAPMSGSLIEVNDRLVQRPELVNVSPYEAGWIARVRLSDPTELERLLDAGAYRALLPRDDD